MMANLSIMKISKLSIFFPTVGQVYPLNQLFYANLETLEKEVKYVQTWQ